jgi:hypothetical protein
MNPENKYETFTAGKDINSVLCNHYDSFGHACLLKNSKNPLLYL